LDVVLNPLNPEKTKTQLMQMAVETNQQRKGIGVIRGITIFCKSNGIKEIICHARNNAVSFYLNLDLRSMMPLWKWVFNIII
jgi:hypothetical protein